MKFFVFFCLGFFILAGFNETTKHKSLKISIKEGSHFYIKGTSNVNTFTCHYQKPIARQTLYLSYQDQNKGWLIENATLALESISFDCGGRRINNDFEDLIKAEEYHSIKIEVCEIQPLGNDFEATLHVSIAGETQVLPVNVVKHKENSEFISSFKLDIEDFSLDKPTKMMGLIKVHNTIEVHVSLNLRIES